MLRVICAGNPELLRIHNFKNGVGQNTALHAAPAASNLAFFISAFVFQSLCISLRCVLSIPLCWIALCLSLHRVIRLHYAFQPIALCISLHCVVVHRAFHFITLCISLHCVLWIALCCVALCVSLHYIVHLSLIHI